MRVHVLTVYTLIIFAHRIPMYHTHSHTHTHTHTHIHIYICIYTHIHSCPGSSAGKESACKAGDPNSISGLGQSPGEGIGYPLQNYWASLVAQMVKNPPIMPET